MLPVAVSHKEKLMKFFRQNFKTWQQKMLFYFTMLNLAKFFKDDPPTIKEGEVDDVTDFTAVEAWEHFDFLCQNYILNRLSDALYEELQLIIRGILAEGMVISESFQVAAIIEKLPPTWNDFKNYLKHKRKEINVNGAKENMVEFKKGKQPQDGSKLGSKGGISKKQKFQGKCFNCNKMRYKSSDCRLPKKVRADEVNDMKEISKEVADMDLCAVISKVDMVDSNPRGWCFDIGATRHICCNKDSFSELVSCDKGDKLYMGNATTSKVKGKGTAVLKMTFGKELKLQNVMYVPNIHKNLISRTLLSVHDFRMVFESQKLILSKG
ncbi:hypothetical protein CXB51_000964 [Gossypium anomalum]|uniref:Retrovirus-related Pol polyprotein from transposon TNT 1-94-like beta-barrel domain-containing protein n=1 Tax=Gossypium anomalum TaxID=47600 RepID=A0A8J6DBT6_9ROSI|nr:hypothetical protein CXB51_000964 [Gossypium anomalum]